MACSALLMTGCGNSKGAQEATTESAAETDEIVIDYSAGLTDEGKIQDVTASDLVTLCDYDNITIKKSDVEPSDEDVQEQVDSLLSNSSYGVYEGSVEEGDTINLDYTGTIDGEEFSGGSASGQDLEIGSDTFIDGFEDQIVGHQVGETFDVEVTFPEDYATEDVAGKDAVFSVTINYIHPELDDDFVATNFSETNGISTVKELKNAIKKNLRGSNENSYIWDYLLTNCEFAEIPEDLMETRLEVSLDTLRKQYHDYMGYGDEQIMTMYGYDSMDEVKEELRENTETSIKYFIVASAVADEQNLVVDDEALDQYLGEVNVDTYYDAYGQPYTNANVLVSMVSDYILEHAKIK